MAYTQIKKGDRGSAVADLQRLLNAGGYTLDTDGVFGAKTQAAVRDYQQKAGLSVDGIAGNKTWSSLYGGSPGGGSPSGGGVVSPPGQVVVGGGSTSGGGSVGGGSYGLRPTYSQSQAVSDALNALSQREASRPGAYQSSYGAQIDALLNKILNRDTFSYDFASDPMYQQYADRYQQQGQLAMQDAMGQAAALTGGYGSSYAQSVGQQAYQSYLSGLNDVIPQLRDAAYAMYRGEGEDMRGNLDLLNSLDARDYGRYRDSVGDYYNDLSYAYGKYSDMSDDDYNRFLTDLNAWESDRAFNYQASRDAQSQANWEREFALAQQSAKASGGGSRGGSSGSSSGSKKSSSGGGKTIKAKSTKNTQTFQAAIKNKNEFNRNKTGYSSYSDYIDKTLEKWYGAGKLNDSEVAYLVHRYNL